MPRKVLGRHKGLIYDRIFAAPALPSGCAGLVSAALAQPHHHLHGRLFLLPDLALLPAPPAEGPALGASAWSAREPDSRGRRFLIRFSHHMPLCGYIAAIFSGLFVPIAILALLVSPQAVAGLARLRELQANNFQLPPQWVEHIPALAAEPDRISKHRKGGQRLPAQSGHAFRRRRDHAGQPEFRLFGRAP